MEYSKLQTEQINPESMQLDQMSVLEAAKLMNRMDREIPDAVEAAIPEIVRTAEMAAASFKKGGRLIYCGAGTSGRLGVLDASECPTTFGVSPDMVIGKIAGGDTALRTAAEGAEDNAELGAQDMKDLCVGENDLVVAVSASGSAAYCLGALNFAKEHGCKTAGVCCVDKPVFAEACDCLIRVITGPEILTGSTRLRAGTATKMVLNMISTLSMKEIGKVYNNLMVDVVPTNQKLRDRAVRIIMSACDVSREEAEHLMAGSGDNIKAAIVCHETGAGKAAAEKALTKAEGNVREAIMQMTE